MKNVSDIISTLGFIIFLIGVVNPSQPWLRRLLVIFRFCMVSSNFYDFVSEFFNEISETRMILKNEYFYVRLYYL